MNRSFKEHLFEIDFLNQLCTVTFDKFNVCLLIKSITFFKKFFEWYCMQICVCFFSCYHPLDENNTYLL